MFNQSKFLGSLQFETASFIDYIIQDFCLRNTTMLTANKISIIPTALFTSKKLFEYKNSDYNSR